MSTPDKPPGLHPLAWAKLVAEAKTGANIDVVMNAAFDWVEQGCPLLEDAPALDPNNEAFELIDAWVALNPQYKGELTPNILSRFVLRDSPGTYQDRLNLISRYHQHKQSVPNKEKP